MAAERSPTRQAFGDMGRSLGLILLVIAVLLLIGPARTLVFPSRGEWKPVDYSSQVRAFERLAGRQPLVPTGLPASWRANAATVAPTKSGDARLHVGFAVPGEHFAGLDEWTGGVGRLPGKTAGTIDVAGVAWQRGTTARDEMFLTRTDGDLTVVVTGDATLLQLQLLAAALNR